MVATSSLKEYMALCAFVILFAVSNVQSEVTQEPSISCSGSELLCGGRVCYDPAKQSCTELGTVVECYDVCGSQCYNSTTQQCFNGTVCSLGQQPCFVKYDNSYGYEYGSPYYQCYDPTSRACQNNTLCSYPSRSCNGRCLLDNQVCINNATVCNVTGSYYDYGMNQIQLCNGVCYDSKIEKCVGGFSTANISLNSSTTPSIETTTWATTTALVYTTPLIQTTTWATTTAIETTTSSSSSSCCSVKECTTDADCCVPGNECQCFRHNDEDYGSCLNPYEQPICAAGCSAQKQCRNDTDCCKQQCAHVTVTDIYGNRVTKSQCVPR